MNTNFGLCLTHLASGSSQEGYGVADRDSFCLTSQDKTIAKHLLDNQALYACWDAWLEVN